MTEVDLLRLQSLDWTFRHIKAREGIHGLHAYPAMMAPPVARTIISELTNPGEVVLDPFCGSGTVPVEAIALRRKAIGFDINPLGLLIAGVKSNPIAQRPLLKTFEMIRDEFRRSKIQTPPEFFNVHFWFKPQVIRDLSRLKEAIERVDDKALRDFYLVVLSRVIRETSNTRGDEFKLFRLPPDKLSTHNPIVWKVFSKRSLEAIKIMAEFHKASGAGLDVPTLQLHDCRESLPLEPESVDLMLTSPPYGDSRTTVAYGQFSRLSLQWMNLWNSDLDSLSLGGKQSRLTKVPSSLESSLQSIEAMDAKRAADVEAFFADLVQCCNNILRVLRTGGFAVYVVANRKVKGITIPTERVITELVDGFKHIVTFQREIPNKRMPLRNSPSNIQGKTDFTMLREYIVILQKATKSGATIAAERNQEKTGKPKEEGIYQVSKERTDRDRIYT